MLLVACFYVLVVVVSWGIFGFLCHVWGMSLLVGGYLCGPGNKDACRKEIRKSFIHREGFSMRSFIYSSRRQVIAGFVPLYFFAYAFFSVVDDIR